MAGDLQRKYSTLKKILKDLGSVLVAYSGGVDSTLLLKVAVDTLGDKNVFACISAGVVEPKHVLRRAKKIAKTLRVRLQTIDAEELKDPHFVANKADRCFHCKSHLCQELIDIALANKLFDLSSTEFRTYTKINQEFLYNLNKNIQCQIF